MRRRRRAAFPDTEDFVNMLSYPGPLEEGVVYAGSVRETTGKYSRQGVFPKPSRRGSSKPRKMDFAISYLFIFGLIVLFLFLFRVL